MRMRKSRHGSTFLEQVPPASIMETDTTEQMSATQMLLMQDDPVAGDLTHLHTSSVSAQPGLPVAIPSVPMPPGAAAVFRMPNIASSAINTGVNANAASGSSSATLPTISCTPGSNYMSMGGSTTCLSDSVVNSLPAVDTLSRLEASMTGEGSRGTASDVCSLDTSSLLQSQTINLGSSGPSFSLSVTPGGHILTMDGSPIPIASLPPGTVLSLAPGATLTPNPNLYHLGTSEPSLGDASSSMPPPLYPLTATNGVYSGKFPALLSSLTSAGPPMGSSQLLALPSLTAAPAHSGSAEAELPISQPLGLCVSAGETALPCGLPGFSIMTSSAVSGSLGFSSAPTTSSLPIMSSAQGGFASVGTAFEPYNSASFSDAMRSFLPAHTHSLTNGGMTTVTADIAAVTSAVSASVGCDVSPSCFPQSEFSLTSNGLISTHRDRGDSGVAITTVRGSQGHRVRLAGEHGKDYEEMLQRAPRPAYRRHLSRGPKTYVPQSYDSDQFWCQPCLSLSKEPCQLHNLQVVDDRPILSMAWASLPSVLEVLRIARTTAALSDEDEMDCDVAEGDKDDTKEVGVFARRPVRNNVMYGPFISERVPVLSGEHRNQGLVYEIDVRAGPGTKERLVLKADSEKACNWMMFVRAAVDKDEQNMVVFQQSEDLYFVTTRDIEPREELKVWYAPHYAEHLGHSLLLCRPPSAVVLHAKDVTRKKSKVDVTIPPPNTGASSPVGANKEGETVPIVVGDDVEEVEKGDEDGGDKDTGGDKDSGGQDDGSPKGRRGLRRGPPRKQRRCTAAVVNKYLRPKRRPRQRNGSKIYSCSECPMLFDILPILQLHKQSHVQQRLHGPLCRTSDQLVSSVRDSGANRTRGHIEGNLNILGDSNMTVRVNSNGVNTNGVTTSGATSSVIPGLFNTNTLGRAVSGISGSNVSICGNTANSGSGGNENVFSSQTSIENGCINNSNSGVTAAGSTQGLARRPVATRSRGRPVVPRKEVPCPVCGVVFGEVELSHHVRVHAYRPGPRCGICNRSFTTRARLETHKKLHMTNVRRDYACDICQRRFMTNSALSCHTKSHSKDQYHACLLCPLRFDKRTDLRSHSSVHRDPITERYACTDPSCSKSFVEFTLARKHMSSIHSGRVFECPKSGCIKKFSRQDKLRLHLATHSEKREFMCEKCGRQFKRKDKLKEHVAKLHSSNKPVKRTPPQFVRKKPAVPAVLERDPTCEFQCPLCVRGFKRRGMFINHLTKSHPEMPIDHVQQLGVPITRFERDFFCQYCDKIYKSNFKRKQHILKHHPGQALPPTVRELQVMRDVLGEEEANSDEEDCDPEVLVGLPVDETYSQVCSGTRIEPYRCTHCPRQYVTRTKLFRHMRKAHDLIINRGKAGTSITIPAAEVGLVAMQQSLQADVVPQQTVTSANVSGEPMALSGATTNLESSALTAVSGAGSSNPDLLTQAMSEIQYVTIGSQQFQFASAADLNSMFPHVTLPNSVLGSASLAGSSDHPVSAQSSLETRNISDSSEAARVTSVGLHSLPPSISNSSSVPPTIFGPVTLPPAVLNSESLASSILNLGTLPSSMLNPISLPSAMLNPVSFSSSLLNPVSLPTVSFNSVPLSDGASSLVPGHIPADDHAPSPLSFNNSMAAAGLSLTLPQLQMAGDSQHRHTDHLYGASVEVDMHRAIINRTSPCALTEHRHQSHMGGHGSDNLAVTDNLAIDNNTVPEILSDSDDLSESAVHSPWPYHPLDL